MIYIQPDPLKPDAIRVIFDSEVIFGKWLLVIRENTKNDQELEEYRKKYMFRPNMEFAQSWNFFHQLYNYSKKIL